METIDLLKKLVSIPSVFPNETQIANFIYKYLKKLGFQLSKVKTASNRYNIVAQFGVSKRQIAFYGHMDTVSAEGWKNPFRVEVNGDVARGLGVGDMKGGLTVILKLAEFASLNKLPIKLIFGVDEEDISRGAHDLVNSGLLKDVSFLVSGESGQVENITQDFSLVYGRKGRILYEIKAHGKKVHAAESEKGVNPIEQATILIRELSKLKFVPHSRLGKSRFVIHSINAQTDSFSVPEECLIRLSLLTTPNISGEKVRKTVLSLAKKLDIIIEIGTVKRDTPYGESYEIDLNNAFLKRLKRQIFTAYKTQAIYATSVADENIFANRLKIPVISLGPIIGGEHTINEWLNLRSLSCVEKVYKDTLKLFLS